MADPEDHKPSGGRHRATPAGLLSALFAVCSVFVGAVCIATGELGSLWWAGCLLAGSILFALLGAGRPVDAGSAVDRSPPADSDPGPWWLGVAIPFGLGAWGTFLYVGRRCSEQRWLVWSGIYAVWAFGGVAWAFTVPEDDTAKTIVSLLVSFGAWVIPALHARRIRDAVHASFGPGR